MTLLGVFACLGLTGLKVIPQMSFNKTEIVQDFSPIIVAVAGEVKQPGTYELAWGSRLEDAISLAGGLSLAADVNLVNLAKPLDAGETIFVPAKQTETGLERISINGSSLAQLDTLPRIGPAMAQRILDARPFNTIEDLLKVKGIGEKTLEKLRPFVTL